MRGAFAFVLTLAAAVLIAAVCLRPPGEGRKPAASDFHTDAAMQMIGQIAWAPHPTGSPQIHEVHDHLVNQLRRLGFEIDDQDFPLDDRAKKRLRSWGAPYADTASGSNIVGLLRGTDPSLPAIALMAHHDTVWASPGAADDSAGVAVILEVVQALTASGPNRHDIVVIFTDAEEISLGGAKAFFADHPLAPRVGFIINLEARGAAGRTAMLETSAGNSEVIRAFARSATRPTANSVAMPVYKLAPNITDFTEAEKKAIPGVNFAFFGKPGLYHSPVATPQRVDPGAVRHMGRQTLALLRTLDAAEVLPTKTAHDAVFADFAGGVLISYPAWVGWPVLALAVAAAVWAVRRSKAQLDRRAVAGGFGAGLGLLILAAALLTAANALSGAGPGASYYDRLASTGWLEIQAFALALGLILLMPRRRLGLWSGWSGLLILGLILSAAAQALAPAATPIVLWPVLGAALVALAATYFRTTPSGVMVSAIIVLVFDLYWAHLLFVGVGQDYPGAMALIALLAVMALWPLLQPIESRRLTLIAGIALLLVGGGVALKVRLDPRMPETATYRG